MRRGSGLHNATSGYRPGKGRNGGGLPGAVNPSRNLSPKSFQNNMAAKRRNPQAKTISRNRKIATGAALVGTAAVIGAGTVYGVNRRRQGGDGVTLYHNTDPVTAAKLFGKNGRNFKGSEYRDNDPVFFSTVKNGQASGRYGKGVTLAVKYKGDLRNITSDDWHDTSGFPNNEKYVQIPVAKVRGSANVSIVGGNRKAATKYLRQESSRVKGKVAYNMSPSGLRRTRKWKKELAAARKRQVG